MKTLLIVLFWLYFVSTVLNLIELGSYDWPHERKPLSLGLHLVSTLVVVVFLFWIGIVLWSSK